MFLLRILSKYSQKRFLFFLECYQDIYGNFCFLLKNVIEISVEALISPWNVIELLVEECYRIMNGSFCFLLRMVLNDQWKSIFSPQDDIKIFVEDFAFLLRKQSRYLWKPLFFSSECYRDICGSLHFLLRMSYIHPCFFLFFFHLAVELGICKLPHPPTPIAIQEQEWWHQINYPENF